MERSVDVDGIAVVDVVLVVVEVVVVLLLVEAVLFSVSLFQFLVVRKVVEK